jgi:hypothetical protein
MYEFPGKYYNTIKILHYISGGYKEFALSSGFKVVFGRAGEFRIGFFRFT